MLENIRNADDPKSPDLDLGSRLRAAREAIGLSQRELAKRTNVSNATISLIEQNRTNPSVGLLKRILDGLTLSLSEFFGGMETSQPRYFYSASELVEIGSGNVSYRQVGREISANGVQILHERYAPGADTGDSLLSHEGEEGGIIIEGRLEVTVDGHIRTLGPGDAYHFSSRLPHRFRNPDHTDCVVVSACTPPSF